MFSFGKYQNSAVLQAVTVSLPLAVCSLQGGAVGCTAMFVPVAGQYKSSFVVACVFNCTFQSIFAHLLKGGTTTMNKANVKTHHALKTYVSKA